MHGCFNTIPAIALFHCCVLHTTLFSYYFHIRGRINCLEMGWLHENSMPCFLLFPENSKQECRLNMNLPATKNWRVTDKCCEQWKGWEMLIANAEGVRTMPVWISYGEDLTHHSSHVFHRPDRIGNCRILRQWPILPCLSQELSSSKTSRSLVH